MSDWIPLFQTLAWVLLITGVLWRFNSEVRSLVGALRERIERGSSVEAGPFKLGASAPAQGIEEQRKRLRAEVGDMATEPGAAQPVQPSGAKGMPATLQSTVLLAEDLAIRQLQAEFGASVSRQVRLGTNLELDGYFAVQGIVYVVEVKYVYRELDVTSLQRRVGQVLSMASQEWGRSIVILALVYADHKRLTDAERSQVKASFQTFGDEVVLRFYVFDELARQLGLVSG